VYLSPAAFSDRIKRLEELLDARLFERTTRRVSLTPAGVRLRAQARQALDAAEHCHAVVQQLDRPVPFSLTLGTRFELGLSWLVPALDALAQTHPERTVHLSFGVGPVLLEQLRRGAVDAVVTSTRLTLGQLDYALLHPEAYVFCAAPALLAEQPLSSAEDARVHCLIDAHADLPLFRYFLDAQPAESAWGFARIHQLGTIAAIRARVLAGHGVAVLPHYFVEPDLQAGRLTRIMPDAPVHGDRFRLIWRADHPRADALRGLAEELRQRPLQ
jgi:DNA-binding transcriptional LysR family regulator